MLAHGNIQIDAAWAFFVVIHALAYVPRLPRLRRRGPRRLCRAGRSGRGEPAGRHARRVIEVLGWRGTRLAGLTASLLRGLVIALLTVHLAGAWQSGA